MTGPDAAWFHEARRRADGPAGPGGRGVVWHAGRRTLLSPPCGVRFLVEDGRAVRYETERGATESDVRAFLLGSVWAVLGWQRGLLPLLAGVVPHTRVSKFHRRRFDGDAAWFHEDAAHLAAELSAP